MEPFGFSISGNACRLPPVGKVRQRAGCTFGDAGRLLAIINSPDAETAFAHYVLGRTELWNMKWTCLDAITTSYASVFKMLDHSVFSFVQSSCRTCGSASRIIAMKTCSRNKIWAAGRILAGLMASDVAQLHSRRSFILKLAGDSARMAPNAFFRVKNNQRFHDYIFINLHPKPLYCGPIKSQQGGIIVLIDCPELPGYGASEDGCEGVQTTPGETNSLSFAVAFSLPASVSR
jgi:hypothetical protein